MKKLLFFLILFLIFISVWYPNIYIRTIPDVNATGGAFIYTKHGGGTTDGSLPYPYPFNDNYGYGVDRAANYIDYSGGYYNSNQLEAGRYKRGECNHCHEPHASFGTAEPLPDGNPNDAGPDPYLLMKEYGTAANYANLCWYCHENFINLNNSNSPLGMGKWSFYQGKSVYENSTHYINPRSSTYPMIWPGTGSGEIWPRKNRSGLPDGNRGSCLNCHTPHGILGSSASPYDIGAVPADRQIVNCAVPPCNPSVNKDYLIPRQLISWEENLCEGCHKALAAGGVAPNIQDEINKRTSGGSGHPIDDTALAGRHLISEAIPITSVEGTHLVTSKHVECYDCHNPHAVKSTNKLEGVRYITLAGVIKDPANGDPQPLVHEVCFKCHADSVATAIGSIGNSNNCANAAPYPTPPSCSCNNSCSCAQGLMPCSNKKTEFQTTNVAFHPVAGPGRNLSLNLCEQLQTGGFPTLDCTSVAAASTSLSNLTINCTDCHNNNVLETVFGPVTTSNLRTTDRTSSYAGTSPVGPHGSTYPSIRRANYKNTYLQVDGPMFFDQNNFNLCYRCHDVTKHSLTQFYTDGARTNFYGGPAMQNLHWRHLGSASGRITCKNCHFNIHSNSTDQNTNTQYRINGTLYDFDPATATPLPTDAVIAAVKSFRLINFSPDVERFVGPTQRPKPEWWYNTATRERRCYLTCHGLTMNGYAYRPPAGDLP